MPAIKLEHLNLTPSMARKEQVLRNPHPPLKYSKNDKSLNKQQRKYISVASFLKIMSHQQGTWAWALLENVLLNGLSNDAQGLGTWK